MAAKRDKKAGWRPFWGRERGEGKLFGKGLGWEAFWEGLRIEGMGGGRGSEWIEGGWGRLEGAIICIHTHTRAYSSAESAKAARDTSGRKGGRGGGHEMRGE